MKTDLFNLLGTVVFDYFSESGVGNKEDHIVWETLIGELVGGCYASK